MSENSPQMTRRQSFLPILSLLLGTPLVLTGCLSPSASPAPSTPNIPVTPSTHLKAKTIATRAPTPTELDLKRSTSLAEIALNDKATALIGPNGEPRFYTGGYDPFSDNRIDYPEKLVTPETRVTSSPIKLKVPNSNVSFDAQFYMIGDGSPQSGQYMQESFSFVVNYYKGILEKTLSSKQNPSPQDREAISTIEQKGGVAKYLESWLAGFSKSNVISVWNQVISDGDGPPYAVTLPPGNPNVPFPTPDAVRKIITQKITHDTLGFPLSQLIKLMGADDEITQNPWIVRFSEGAGSCLYNAKTRQFSIAINPSQAHWFSPNIAELQTDKAVTKSALVNEFANIVAEGLDPSVQALMYSQIEKEAGVNQARLAQAQKDHPNVRNEFASTMAMIEYQKSVLAAHK
ncbi:hypothetical protein HZC27_01315 [Candidatus Roizmanbacteria bacterium]|nr:hypothetical protein [Candidatus Roizmanbacteria bacterium]